VPAAEISPDRGDIPDGVIGQGTDYRGQGLGKGSRREGEEAGEGRAGTQFEELLCPDGFPEFLDPGNRGHLRREFDDTGGLRVDYPGSARKKLYFRILSQELDYLRGRGWVVGFTYPHG